MKRNFLLGALMLALLLPMLALADVAPGSGYKRVSVNLIVTPAEDIADYRLFIKSGADLREITLKKGEAFTIKPLGGGAYYSGGVLLAVPTKNLSSLSDKPGDKKLTEMQQAIYDGKVAGTIEVVKHPFAREVRTEEAAKIKDAEYRIVRSKDGLAAETVGGATNVNGTGGPSFGITGVERGPTPFAMATIVGGALMSIGIILVGIILFSKRAKRTQ